MKRENQLRLARIAQCDVINGGARALVLLRRIERLHPGSEANDIVTRVYHHPRGRASYACPECGEQFVSPEEANACCQFELFEDDNEPSTPDLHQ